MSLGHDLRNLVKDNLTHLHPIVSAFMKFYRERFLCSTTITTAQINNFVMFMNKLLEYHADHYGLHVCTTGQVSQNASIRRLRKEALKSDNKQRKELLPDLQATLNLNISDADKIRMLEGCLFEGVDSFHLMTTMNFLGNCNMFVNISHKYSSLIFYF